jgi:hypothetical protein
LLASLDDFYIISSPKESVELVVIETTNDLLNPSLYKLVVPQTCLCWIRAVAANSLATSGSSWSDLFSIAHSGTYTNQWMVMDMSLFVQGSAPQAGFFTVLEEVPGTVVYRDMTSLLVDKYYWPSYNVPYFQEISVLSGNALACAVSKRRANDTEYCWDSASRASLFGEKQGALRTVSDLQTLMYYNQWQSDAVSGGDSCKSVSCRRDLETDPRTRYPSGGIDSKVSSVLQARRGLKGKGGFIQVRMGPTNDDQQTFCWSNLVKKYVHTGQPDCFDYKWTQLPPNSATD